MLPWRYPDSTRGATAHRHGRGSRDAVDATVAGLAGGVVADGEGVWSRPPDAGVKSRRASCPRGDGG
jgi:hypothetical protein